MPEEDFKYKDIFRLTEYYGDHHSSPKDYDQSVLEYVFGKGKIENWDNAIDIISELRSQKDRIIDTPEAGLLLQDLQRLSEMGIPFTSSPIEATKIAKENRYENR